MSERFDDQQKEVLQLLKVLNDNQLLQHVIVVGSWAEFVYAQAGVLPGFELTLRTIDMDFLVKNLRRPSAPVNLSSLAKSEGYLIQQDRLLGTTKMFSEGGLEVEFLICQRGSGETPVLKTNLGVTAQALRHMDGLASHSITVDLLGMPVQVPCPEIYVLHKMLINHIRKPEKQEKDRKSILRLLPHINLEKASQLCNSLTKKEKNSVRDFVATYGDEFYDQLGIDDRIKWTKFVSESFPEIQQKTKVARLSRTAR